MMTTDNHRPGPDLEVVRTMAASPQRIWDAWVDARLIALWWGPNGFTSTVRELEVRSGGRFDVVMRGPNGAEFSNVYMFDEVEPGRRIVYVHQGSLEHGLAPSRSIVDMTEVNVDPPKTNVTLCSYYATDHDRQRHLEDFRAVAGARQLLERLERIAVAGNDGGPIN